MSDETRAVADDQSDQGVPVGDADVQADIDRASGENRELDDADVTGQPWRPDEGPTDEGEPVGTADVEADRRRAGS